jgi:2'-5' RNA ligase
MRTFLAIEIPDEIKTYLTSVTKEMSRYADGVKWVKESAQHITLKFFGEINEDMVWNIKKSIDHLGTKHGKFSLALKCIDAFPSQRKARVIVVTLENGVDNIVNIFNDIEYNVSTLGIEKETRPFVPHITLGRRKTPTPLLDKALIEIEGMSFRPMRW